MIISGAGLPIDMPKFVAEAEQELCAEGKMEPEFMGDGADEAKGTKRRTMIAPIVSSVKSAMVICRMWEIGRAHV